MKNKSKNAKMILSAATLSLGIALGVNSASSAKPPATGAPKLEGGKEGIANADMHKMDAMKMGNHCKMEKVESGQLKGEIMADQHKHSDASAGYIKFDGVEGECAAQHKVQMQNSNQVKQGSSQIKMESADQLKQGAGQIKMEEGASYIKK